MNEFHNFSWYFLLFVDNEGAAAVCQRQTMDQRKPRQISIESFRNQQLEFDEAEQTDLLPFGSSIESKQSECTDTIDEKCFFSGNPFVEIVKGIIHIYKKKWVLMDLIANLLFRPDTEKCWDCIDLKNWTFPHFYFV